MIFPSKLLFYLKFRRPVLSPLLPGLSPEYASLLMQPSNPSPEAWIDTMERAANLSPSDVETLASKSRQFMEQKTWKRQAARLVEFLFTLQH
jgi:hypothetical protein